MAKAIQVADTDPAPAIATCTAAGALANTCSGPTPIAFSNYKDPSGASAACTTGGTTAASAGSLCAYTIGTATAVGTLPGAAATTQNFKICSVLEGGNSVYGGSATTNGWVHVGSDTGGSVVAGC
jgi:hypothetical protein